MTFFWRISVKIRDRSAFPVSIKWTFISHGFIPGGSCNESWLAGHIVIR
jgi:hypothetical protein